MNFVKTTPCKVEWELISKEKFVSLGDAALTDLSVAMKRYPAAGSTLSGGAPHGRSADASPINRPWM